VGCIVQVTTQQKNQDESYALAEAITFVPGVRIVNDGDTWDRKTGRHLVAITQPTNQDT
jgi:hypothetical protein